MSKNSPESTPPPRSSRPSPERIAAWRKIFLDELKKWGVVDHAIREAGVSRTTAYTHRKQDPAFAQAWDEAKGQIVATMEVVLRQRALVGVRTPVIFQGKVVDHVNEVDTGALKWLLAKLKPEVYGEKVDHNLKHSGDVNVNVSGRIDVRQLTDEQLITLRDILGSAPALGGSADRVGAEEPL